ncbi:hypothetical protein R1sor_015326 [Riccia sorocarpa]|uniref:Uncharacterized protein n=1 Tax=Riccia sorocarpa TaxID=122646 RepID=A0ABD3HEM4_9MARC
MASSSGSTCRGMRQNAMCESLAMGEENRDRGSSSQVLICAQVPRPVEGTWIRGYGLGASGRTGLAQD